MRGSILSLYQPYHEGEETINREQTLPSLWLWIVMIFLKLIRSLFACPSVAPNFPYHNAENFPILRRKTILDSLHQVDEGPPCCSKASALWARANLHDLSACNSIILCLLKTETSIQCFEQSLSFGFNIFIILMDWHPPTHVSLSRNHDWFRSNNSLMLDCTVLKVLQLDRKQWDLPGELHTNSLSYICWDSELLEFTFQR